MSGGFEKQLAAIADKAALLTYVESLPDGSKGLLLIELPRDPDANDDLAWYRYREIGDVTLAESVYMLRSYEHYLFSDVRVDD